MLTGTPLSSPGVTMPETEPPKPCWYQFSLRTLLLFTLVAAILFGFLGRELQQAREEKKAAENLVELGAGIDDWPGWQEIVFGSDYPPITQVNLYGVQEIDAALAHIQRLEHLAHLSFGGTNVTDANLEKLRGLTGIESLDLGGTGVSDSGLEHLEELSGLRFLYLSKTRVTEEGVKKLEEALPNCQIDW